jgi:hydrogenase maturation factor
VTLPVGKLPAPRLAGLVGKHVVLDDRVVLGPRVGEDAAVIDMGDRFLVATTDPVTFVTDGLATALWEVAGAAGVGLAVEAERVPILPEGRALCEAFGLDPLGTLATGGRTAELPRIPRDELARLFA